MLTIAPFKGLTYNFNENKDISRLVAPPYDVISPEEQRGYYQADPHNVIRLILGEKRTGDSDWDNRYTRAADDFQRWQSNRTLIRGRPSLPLPDGHDIQSRQRHAHANPVGYYCLGPHRR